MAMERAHALALLLAAASLALNAAGSSASASAGTSSATGSARGNLKPADGGAVLGGERERRECSGSDECAAGELCLGRSRPRRCRKARVPARFQ